jgi:four helix bundle protein
VSLSAEHELPGRLFRQIDESVTSVILNIAEGNGRYSEMDHRRFIDIAEGCAVKTAAYLDIAVQKNTLSRNECGPGTILVERIMSMLSRM